MDSEHNNQTVIYEDNQEGMSIAELFHILKNRFWWIVLVFVLVVGASVFYLNNVTPLYDSEVTILVESLAKGGDFESMLLGQSGAKIATEVELILSRTNLNKALEELDLNNYKTIDGVLYSQGSATRGLKERTNVTTVKDTNIVRIKVTDQNPAFARDFANALAASYNELLGSIARTNKTVQKEFIESQIPVNEQQLKIAADNLGKFREESNFIQLSDKSKLLSAKIAYFQLQREPLELQLKEADLIIENYQDRLAFVNNNFPFFKKVLNDKKIVSLYNSYKESNREQLLYQAIQEGISENKERLFVLQSSLNQNSKAILDQINAIMGDYKVNLDPLEVVNFDQLAKAYHQKLITKATIEVLEVIEDSYSEELGQLPMLERQLLDLERDVQVYETLRMRLLELLEEVKIAEAAVAGTVTIVDPAIISASRSGTPIPVSPNQKLILAVALLLGIALGVLFALLLEVLDNTIKDEITLRRVVGFNRPVLGWIPLMSYDKKLKIPNLIVYNDSLSFEAERYKLIANNVTFGSGKKNKKIIGITSSSIGEGKTTLSANIATSLAMNGFKVMLIEGDLRLPQLEDFFGIKKIEKGIVDVVAEGYELSKAIVQPIDDVPLLHLLAPGKLPPLPSAIFSSPNYIELLEELKEVYDYIFIDTPPLVFASELMTIASHVGGMVVNMRAGISTKGSVRELLDNLDLAEVNLIGVVFNGVIETRMGGYYSGGRYYNYRGYDYSKTQYGSSRPNHKRKVKRGYKRAFRADLKERAKRSDKKRDDVIFPFIDSNNLFKDFSPTKEVKKDKIDLIDQIALDSRAKGKKEDNSIDKESSK
ncbi:MAG: GumC family protein [Sphaerochaetaceae bacterium]